MPLTPQDIARIATLARLEMDAAHGARMLTQLNGFFDIVGQMNAVDTTGVEPYPFVSEWEAYAPKSESKLHQGAVVFQVVV